MGRSPPRATRRGRGALRTVRPGRQSRRGRGAPSRGRRPRSARGNGRAESSRQTREGAASTLVHGPGKRRSECGRRGAVKLAAGAASHLRPRALPSRPGAGRDAPPRRKCARPGPTSRAGGGVPRGDPPNRRAAVPYPAELNPPGGLRGPHPFTSQRFHALLNSLFKVLFNFPLRYLSTIGLVPVFSLRWSLPPALGCIPKQPDSEKTVPRRAGGRYRPHTVHGLSLDQKDSGPRTTPGKRRSSIHHISRARQSDGDSVLGSSLFARRYWGNPG